MVKRTLSALLSAVLAFSLLLTGAYAAEAPAWSVQSATWQDPNNVMLIWEAEDGYTYNIYRAASAGGEYELIGTAEGGSFRDAGYFRRFGNGQTQRRIQCRRLRAYGKN